MPVVHVPRLVDGALALLTEPFASAEGSNWQRLLIALLGERGVHPILAVDTAARQFTVATDVRWMLDVRAPKRADVRGSTGNNGVFTIVRGTLDSLGRTVLTVEQPVPSATADGTIEIASHGLQEVEDNLRLLSLIRQLSTARGTLLDAIGGTVGLARTSTDDEDYRRRIVTRIGINFGHGSHEELIETALALDGVDRVRLSELVATLTFDLYGTALPSAAVRAELCSSVAGGVRCLITAAASAEPFNFGPDVDAAGLPSPGGDPEPGEGFSEALTIAALVVGPPGQLLLSGNRTGFLAAAQTMRIWASTGNDARYTIATVAYEAGPDQTRVTFTVALPSPVADGVALYGGPETGPFVELFAP